MICPYCNNEAVWCENKEIYGRNYGNSYMCYYCKPCDAYVGCHENTQRALGTMANKETREWRIKAHDAFDPIWQNKPISRLRAYEGLNNHFGFPVHIGSCDIKMCKKIIKFCKRKAKNMALKRTGPKQKKMRWIGKCDIKSKR